MPNQTESAMNVVVGLMKASEQMKRRSTSKFAEHGITGQQFNVLRILRGAHPAPIPTLDIAERMIEHSPGITRLIDRIEQKGWCTRTRSPEDRRQVMCSITQQGLKLLANMDKDVARLNEEQVAMLNPAERTELNRLLQKILEQPS